MAVVLALTALAAFCAAPATASRAPIVLVHGFAGWGPDELAGIKYWGFFTDIQQQLIDDGHDVHTAVVGPFSSNYDRAVELFHNIQGGRVDYGPVHSAQYNHDRYGRTFDGLYRDWGTTDPETGRVRKVHLVTHSMGGTTARKLVHLLRHGSPQEIEAGAGSEVSRLFEGGHPWIESVVTVAAPHDGTSMVTASNFVALVQTFLIGLAAFLGLKPENVVYDVKLDHFGLRRLEGESFTDYLDKVFSSPIWDPSFEDLSPYDLAPDTAIAFNRDTPADPEVYYFTYTNAATNQIPITGFHVPQATMIPVFYAFAVYMGTYRTLRSDDDKVDIDRTWNENDGVVNLISQDGPKVGSSDVIVRDTDEVAPGRFHYLGDAPRHDHANVIGLLKSVREFYGGIAEMLAALPHDASETTLNAPPPLSDENEGDDDDDNVDFSDDPCATVSSFYTSCAVNAPLLGAAECGALYEAQIAGFALADCDCAETLYFAEDEDACEAAKTAVGGYEVVDPEAGDDDDDADDDDDDDDVVVDNDGDDDDDDEIVSGGSVVVISSAVVATLYMSLRLML